MTPKKNWMWRWKMDDVFWDRIRDGYWCWGDWILFTTEFVISKVCSHIWSKKKSDTPVQRSVQSMCPVLSWQEYVCPKYDMSKVWVLVISLCQSRWQRWMRSTENTEICWEVVIYITNVSRLHIIYILQKIQQISTSKLVENK